MNLKQISLGVSAIMASYLMMMLPLVGATEVNIMFNGQPQVKTEISPANLVNKQMIIVHDPSDITWTNVRVKVSLSAATLSKSISRIYLYKCKGSSPVDCAKSEPVVFESYIDTELAWVDISEKSGAGLYPQEGHLLVIVKLEDGRDTWTGFWTRVERTDYNVFNVYEDELPSMDIELDSLDLLEPMQTYIENYQMIPFNWAKEVIFKGASTLFSLGGDEADIIKAPPTWQTAQPTSSKVTSIAKEFFFVLPEDIGGINHPVILNQNPDFTCGNNICENDLGETRSVCCYDCGCSSGQYCDMANAQDPKSGTCRPEPSGLQILPPSVQLTDCTKPFTLNLVLQVLNAPSNLPETLTARFTLNGTPYSVGCTGTAGSYSCPIQMAPPVGCGVGTYTLSDNTASMTITYSDGLTGLTRELTAASFPDISINYNCACPSGYFCDAGLKQCRTEGSLALTIVSVRSFVSQYKAAGDTVDIVARINNPPSDLGVTGIEYVLGNFTYDGYVQQGMSGSINCNPIPGSAHTYNCSIPFTIPAYNHEKQYVIRGNSLKFTVTFSSGADTIVKQLVTAFSDVTIPGYRCGDATCNPEENQDNCCVDCGCPTGNHYCDKTKGCRLKDGVNLVIDKVYPTEFDDCRKQHTAAVTARVLNVPSDINLDYYYFKVNDEIMGWQINCPSPSPATGISNCELLIPPLDGTCQASSDPYVITPAKLEMTLTFGDGFKTLTRTVTAPVEDITINPTYTCGDKVCEAVQGETAENCCVDCLSECEAMYGGNGFCDSDSQLDPDGTCINKNEVRLVVDSPVNRVNLQSCERSQLISILAHVENQPHDMRVENYWAEIDGASTEDISCQQKQMYRGANTTYNCSIRIPSKFECSQGSVFDYRDNKLYFFVSYANGRQAQEISDDIPQIVQTQSIRSIFDIMWDIQNEMRSHLQKIKSIAEQMKTGIEICIGLMVVALVISLIVGIKGFGATWGKWAMMGEFAKGWGAFNVGIAGMVKALCDMIQKYYETQLKLEEADFDLLQMTMCLDLYQHRVDNGDCRGNEQSCFSSMQQCINEGRQALSTSMSAANQAFQGMTQGFQDFATSAKTMAEGIAQMGMATGDMNHTGKVRVSWDSETTNKVCGYYTSGTVGPWTTRQKASVKFSYESDGIYPCQAGNIVFTRGDDKPETTHVKATTMTTDEFFTYAKAAGTDTVNEGTMKVTFWCMHGPASFVQIGTPMTFCYCQGTDQAGCKDQDRQATGEKWACKEAWKDCSGTAPGTTGAATTPTGQPEVSQVWVDSQVLTAGAQLDINAGYKKITILFSQDMSPISMAQSGVVNLQPAHAITCARDDGPVNNRTYEIKCQQANTPLFTQPADYYLEVTQQMTSQTGVPVKAFTRSFSVKTPAAPPAQPVDLVMRITKITPSQPSGGYAENQLVNLSYSIVNLTGNVNKNFDVSFYKNGVIVQSYTFRPQDLGKPWQYSNFKINKKVGTTKCDIKMVADEINTLGEAATARANNVAETSVDVQ